MGLFGPSQAELERQRLDAERLKVKRLEKKLERARGDHEQAIRHWVALDLLAGRRIRAMSMNLPLGSDLTIEQIAREERERLELIGYVLPRRGGPRATMPS